MKSFLYTLPLLLGLALTGCNQTQEPSSTETQTSQSQTTETATTAKKQNSKLSAEYVSPLPDDAPSVSVVVSGVAEPFAFKNEFGKMIGLEVDIIRAIGEEAGFKVNFNELPHADLLNSVESGKNDIGLGLFGNTPEREQKFNMSDTYLDSPSIFVYLDDTVSIKNGVNGLDGLRVGVIPGSIHAKEITAANTAKEIVEAQTPYLMISGLLQNKSDVIVYDKTLLMYLIPQFPEMKGKVKFAPYADVDPTSKIVMAINKDNNELDSKVNAGIKAIKENGKLNEIIVKWIGETD